MSPAWMSTGDTAECITRAPAVVTTYAGKARRPPSGSLRADDANTARWLADTALWKALPWPGNPTLTGKVLGQGTTRLRGTC